MNLCEDYPSINIIGLEIRKPVVDFALSRKKQRGLQNVHFIGTSLSRSQFLQFPHIYFLKPLKATNANVDLVRIITDVEAISHVDMICIQFPDPHFKTKHKKRRVVKDDFVEAVAGKIKSGTKVFLQSDVVEVIDDMVATFSANSNFIACDSYDINNLTANISPVSVQTEREKATIAKGLPVYRMLFAKK